MRNETVGKPVTLGNLPSKALNRALTIGTEFWLLVLRIVGFVPIHTVRKLIYILSGINMPFDSTIHMGANFFYPAGVTIGHDTIVGDHAFLDGRAPLKIGNHVGIASQVLIYNDEHDINSPDYGNSYGPVTVGDYVFIGPRAIILPGVTIGKGAVVAAGAVVTKNIPEFEIWGGVPAKKISDRSKNINYRLGRAMLFQ
ncbi:MAG TPA: acyltransferase [Patescibacteria group bacterium]